MTIFIKDDLRASVEAATGGLVTVLYTAAGHPSYMNVIPSSTSRTSTHRWAPACIRPSSSTAWRKASCSSASMSVASGQQPAVLPRRGAPGQRQLRHLQDVGGQQRPRHMMTNAEWAAIALVLEERHHAAR